MSAERAIGHVSQIPLGEGRNFEVEGTLLTVFRPRAGGLYATQPHCPHRQGPLSDGLLGGTTLVCPLHETTFDLCTGRSLTGDFLLRTYPVRAAEDGQIILTLTEVTAGVC